MPVRDVTALRHPRQFFGSWEVGLLALMALLYIAGALINPAFFGTPDALHALLRDSSRYGVMAVGMTFVIVNKDIDLSVGSTFGLVGVAFSILFSPTHYNLDLAPALGFTVLLGLAIGLVNGALVTLLRVPAFIATLTMLLIGRGLVLGLTGGKNIAYPAKAQDYAAFFHISETNALGFNNQIVIFVAVAVIGGIRLAKTRLGCETLLTGSHYLGY